MWIIEHITCVLTLFYNAICYILPCVNKIIYWTSNNLKNYISYFGNKYDPLIEDELEEDEKEFSWWTKYYVFKNQKVVKSCNSNNSIDQYNKGFAIVFYHFPIPMLIV